MIGGIAATAEPEAGLEARLAHHAATRPGAPAYTFLHDRRPDRTLSFGALADASARVAAAVRRRTTPGDRVALVARPSLEGVVGIVGLLRSGAVAVPLPPPAGRPAAARFAAVMADCAPALVLTTEATAHPFAHPTLTVEAALAGDGGPPPRLGPDDVALLQYTSGATAAPKGVVITNANIAAVQRMIGAAFGTTPDDTVVSWLPTEHDMGLLGGVLHGLWCGIHTVLMAPAAFLRRPRRWLAAIGDHRATISGGPNFAFDLCVDAVAPAERDGLSLVSWRVAFNGAEPVRADTLARFTAAFAPAGFDGAAHYPCYGLAEATLLASGGESDRAPRLLTPDAARPGKRLVSCGRLRCPGLIVDPHTRAPLGEGAVGEIWLGGPSVAGGYFGRPEATAATFGARTADGDGPFLRTGDLGRVDGGELFVAGRVKDLLIVAGRNVHPADLERAAADVPGCRPGRTVAIDEEDGPVLIAEVAATAEPAALARAIWRRMLREAGVALAAAVLVRPGTVLWTTSGKLRRLATAERVAADPACVVHRADFASSEGAAAAQRRAVLRLGAARDAEIGRFVETWLSAALALAPDALDPDATFADLGLTSLAAVELAADLEAATGLAVEDTLLFDHPTPRALAGELGARLAR